MAIIDIFTYNGEADLLEIRLNVLNDYVDEFVIIECKETFSGKPKPLYYEEQKERFNKWENKIKYHIVEFPYKDSYIVLANESPNTDFGKGAKNWVTEFCQKESIQDAITHLNDDDICFIGDVDEIWNPEHLICLKSIQGIEKMKLDVFTYYLNNHSSEDFWGTIYGKYRDIKNVCLNHLRSNSVKTVGKYGWHFTSMGGYEQVKRKLSDSYTRESYWTPEVENNLEVNIATSRDFLGRNFVYTVDESRWPEYLIKNRHKYIQLLK